MLLVFHEKQITCNTLFVIPNDVVKNEKHATCFWIFVKNE